MVSDRFNRGMGVVTLLWGPIYTASNQFNVWQDLVASIIAHESQASERRTYRAAITVFAFIPSLFMDDPADTAERTEAKVRGDKASIGVAQMQVGLAKRLRTKFPSIKDEDDVVDDLLEPSVAVRYVAAAVRELRDNLDAFLTKYGFKLSDDEMKDLVALGYNIGWEALRDRNLSASDMGDNIPARVAKIRETSSYIKLTIGQWREIGK